MTMHKIFTNVLENEGEEKFRKARVPRRAPRRTRAVPCAVARRPSPQCMGRGLLVAYPRPVGVLASRLVWWAVLFDAQHKPFGLAQVKIASKTYQSNIAGVKHAEDLMLQAGWRPQVRFDCLPRLCPLHLTDTRARAQMAPFELSSPSPTPSNRCSPLPRWWTCSATWPLTTHPAARRGQSWGRRPTCCCTRRRRCTKRPRCVGRLGKAAVLKALLSSHCGNRCCCGGCCSVPRCQGRSRGLTRSCTPKVARWVPPTHLLGPPPPTQRKRIEREARLQRDSEERQKIKAAIDADRAERQERLQREQEAAAAVAAAAAQGDNAGASMPAGSGAASPRARAGPRSPRAAP